MKVYDFGEQLKYLRKRKKYTQKALGSLVDVSGDTISKYERNIRQPTVLVLKRLALNLDTTADFLIGMPKVEDSIYLSLEKFSQEEISILMGIHKIISYNNNFKQLIQ